MGWFRELRLEWRARREGRKYVTSNLSRVMREATGSSHKVMRYIEKGGDDTYVESFDRRLPPSVFVSERDRRRANMPMPLVERCIEDWGKEPSEDHDHLWQPRPRTVGGED